MHSPWLLCLCCMLSHSYAFLKCTRSSANPLLLKSAKADFLTSLDNLATLNEGTETRTDLLNRMISNKVLVEADEIKKIRDRSGKNDESISRPASLSSMLPVAPGTWKVVYAPHISTIVKLVGGGKLDVEYILHSNQKIQSHAKFASFPWMLGIKSIFLSVNGTYDSMSDSDCVVEWKEAWIKIIDNNCDDEEDKPFATFSEVPDSVWKDAINDIGQFLFIKPFSLFPVSFLSPDLTVFDFDLFGTRICARKIQQRDAL
mmetsp:Transcript_32849/g.49563  ORF Transcript_32849/g.49563 Transcript_32849/m.49563 type:complete len:259 (+) Transcript_32849:110-886(+)